MAADGKISVLLATLDRGELERTLDQLDATTAGLPVETVVVSPFALDRPRVRAVVETRPGGAIAAYNRAFAEADGEFVVHMTDMKGLVPGWLEAGLGHIARHDRGDVPFVACLPMHDPSAGARFVGTVFGLLYPWLSVFRRAPVAALQAEYLDTGLRYVFSDCDFGMRVWAGGGRCEIVADARYDHLPDKVRVRPPELEAARAEKTARDFSHFVDKWFPRFGEGFATKRGDGLSELRTETVCIDVPEMFWPAMTTDRAIAWRGDPFVRIAGPMRAAAAIAHARGVPIPGALIANPTGLRAWLESVAGR